MGDLVCLAVIAREVRAAAPSVRRAGDRSEADETTHLVGDLVCVGVIVGGSRRVGGAAVRACARTVADVGEGAGMDGFERLVRDAVPLAAPAGGARRGRRVAHSAAPGQALRSAVPDDALSHRVPGDTRTAAGHDELRPWSPAGGWTADGGITAVLADTALVPGGPVPAGAGDRVSTHAWMGPDGLVIPLLRSTTD